MKRVKKILRSHSGVALITVILIISILVAAALELNRSSRAQIFILLPISAMASAYVDCQSGFYAAAALLINARNEYETLRDDWANAEVLSAQSNADYFPMVILW